MAIRRVSIFLALKQGSQSEVELRTFPETVVANIIRDVDTGQLIEIDDVLWSYLTQPPAEANAVALTQPPAPETVFFEIRFAPNQTPFPLPTSFRAPLDEVSPVEADAASYGNIGTQPIMPNAVREDSAVVSEGEQQETETDGGFEYLARNYKYAVILTTPNQVFTLDPRVRVRSRHRRTQS